MSNTRDYCNTEDDGLMVASRFFKKLHMSYKRFAEIRMNWAKAPVQRGSKTFDAIFLSLICSTSRQLQSFEAALMLSSMSRHLDGMARTKSVRVGPLLLRT